MFTVVIIIIVLIPSSTVRNTILSQYSYIHVHDLKCIRGVTRLRLT